MGLTYEQARLLGIAELHPDHPGNAPAAAPAAPAAPRRSKYGSRRTVYAGVAYHSKAEASRAEALDDLKARGLVSWWLGQPRFRLGVPENVYVADFLVVSRPAGPGGGLGVRAEDVKGVYTPKFARDVRLWRRYGPCCLWILRRGKLDEIITPESQGDDDG